MTIARLRFAALVLMVSACRSGGGGSGDDNVADPDAAPTTELEGDWQKQCIMGDDGLPETSSREQSLNFSGNTFTLTERYFVDTACDGALQVTLIQTGSFVIGDASTGLADAIDIDFTQLGHTATPYGGYAATLDCTRGGNPVAFMDGTATDIAGAVCDGGDAQPADGAVLLGVFKLYTEGTPRAFQLGAAAVGSELGNEATRPTAFGTYLYIEQ